VARGRLVRLDPNLLRKAAAPGKKPAVLELAYQLQLGVDRPGRTPVTTTLAPPRCLDDPGDVPTRWQITAPPSWVVLGPEPGLTSPVSWGRQGWLLAPRPRLREADLDAWFRGLSMPAPEATAKDLARATPSLVLWQESGEPVRLTHAPRWLWLVACSFVVAGLGIFLKWLALSPVAWRVVLAWLLIVAVAVAVLGVVVFYPALAGQIAFGCQPGVLALLLVVLLQWAAHERYRRRIIFLPSFSRGRSGSSMLRQEQARLPHGEPSTVDVPSVDPARRPGSSVERGGS
jgi:hypothetical protein